MTKLEKASQFLFILMMAMGTTSMFLFSLKTLGWV